MKATTRRNGKSTQTVFPKAAKGRWLPDDTTRPRIFADRKAVGNKRACRGPIAFD